MSKTCRERRYVVDLPREALVLRVIDDLPREALVLCDVDDLPREALVLRVVDERTGYTRGEEARTRS
jgi:hypothetical protein